MSPFPVLGEHAHFGSSCFSAVAMCSSLLASHSRIEATTYLSTGSTELKAAAATAGVVQTLVQLLETDQTSRLAYEAADLLTVLTTSTLHQQGVALQAAPLHGLISLTRKLLQASDALSDSPLAERRNALDVSELDGTAASDQLAASNSFRSQLSSLKIGSRSDQLPPSGLEQPRLSWSASSLLLVPGSPPILTLPNGQHCECAIPKSPPAFADTDLTGLRLPADAPHAAAASAVDVGCNQDGLASTSASTQFPTPISRTFTRAPSIQKNSSRALSASLSGSWIGSLVKRLRSANAQDPGQEGKTPHPESARQPDPSTTLSPFASPVTSPKSPSALNHFARSQSVKSESLLSNSARANKKTYQPRHPSQTLLKAVVTAMAHLIEGDPHHQSTIAELGAIALAQDLLTLAGNVGMQGGLFGVAADLVRCLSNNNPTAQKAFGHAGSVGQLLSLLQVHVPRILSCLYPATAVFPML